MKNNSNNKTPDQKQAKADRLAQALKDNLKRRKMQARKLNKDEKAGN